MFNIKLNNLIRSLSKKALAGLVFGTALVVGIVAVVAFTEPSSGPTGFDEPENVQDKGDWSAYGRSWSANSSGAGSTILTKTACDSAYEWYWFQDGNGDSDEKDEEDGICVKATTTPATTNGAVNYSWNGDNSTSTDRRDNTYIAAYTCAGNFPDGYVATYGGWGQYDVADNVWNEGDCALCQTDCYDGKKDLPNQGSYAEPHEGSGDGKHEGPITPEVLKNWKGTRLPTHNDFFGFCGYKAGSGTDKSYATDCSSVTTLGNYGQMVGRTDECIDETNSGTWQWLSAQHSGINARIAGIHACSNFGSYYVYSDYRFRAVFRP